MKNKNRTGSGYNKRAPTGLIEHSKNGSKMNSAFESKFTNSIFELFISIATSDTTLTALRGLRGTKLISVLRKSVDEVGKSIDKVFFNDIESAKLAFMGKITSKKYKSAFGGFYWEFFRNYIEDWTKRQENKEEINPPIRYTYPLKKTYQGWKKLRDEIQPGWKPLPKNNSIKTENEIIKSFNEDTMSPYERIENLIKGKSTDRVGFGPQMDWATAWLGGSNTWKFCYDGIETGWAALNTWIRIGGCDFLPDSSGLAAYTIPFPEGHSRFYYKWGYPQDNSVPQFLEEELLKTYDDLFNYGMSGLAQEISKRMIRDMFVLIREIIYQAKVKKHYFGAYQDQFFPYAQGLFAVWDVLPFWRSMVPLMRDYRKKPEVIIEAFEFLNKPFTDFWIHVLKMTKAKTALFGNSRGSNTWISPKTFEQIYWPSMKYSFDKCFENGIIPTCHLDNDWTENMEIFAEKLPKRSCIFHLDQVDLVKVHDKIGDKFCLMGGMSPALLVNGRPDQVEAETKRYIENIGSDGLIIASGCEYPADTPIQNIFAQKRAIKKYGFF